MTNKYEKIDPILYVKEKGELKPDPLWDDQALFLKSEKGLIIILGCAHRGIINTIRHAQKLTGLESVYDVIGGTHLIGASPERMDSTIAELLSFSVQRLEVSHCIGLPAPDILAHTFGEAFFFDNTGTHISLWRLPTCNPQHLHVIIPSTLLFVVASADLSVCGNVCGRF